MTGKRHFSSANYLRFLFILILASCLQTTGCALHSVSGEFGSSLHADTDEGKVRLKVLRTARSMIGTPYRYGGSAPGGFDCSGLVFYSYKKAGVTIPRTSQDQYRKVKRVANDKLLPGDLLFFQTRGRGVSHVGIYQGGNTFIHAPVPGKRVSRDSVNNPYWKKHFIRGGRII